MDFVDEDSCVHGGLTFSILDPDTGCWVLGFDCYHAYDAPTPEDDPELGTYRDEAYVTANCKELCERVKMEEHNNAN